MSESQCSDVIIGRLLVGQATDPRLAGFDNSIKQLSYERVIRHADGTLVKLRYKRPDEALMSHLRRAAIDIPELLSYFQKSGIRRFEISNVLQGIELILQPEYYEWKVSLHLPIVPLSIARKIQNNQGTLWRHPTFPVDIYIQDNMIVYSNNVKPENLILLPVDRLVFQIGQLFR